MAYIANRPVRFDRNYAVGEKIPDEVIDPKMTTKLIGMGRIIHIADTDPTGNAEKPTGGENGQGEVNTNTQSENATEGESDGVSGTNDGNDGGTDGESNPAPAADPADSEEKPKEYRCAECGKTFATANGLASHTRTHKK